MSSIEWKDIPGYEGYYQVSSDGQVRSLDRETKSKNRWGSEHTLRIKGRVLSPSKYRGYCSVSLVKNGEIERFLVHHLVLIAFVGNPPQPGMHCCHWNGVRHDNRVENLRWGTPKDNAADR